MTSDATYYQVVLGDRPGYLAVAFGYDGYWDNGKYKHREWIERRYPWPAGKEQLETDVSQLRAAQERVDVYACAAVRFTDDRRKGSALPPQVLWTDNDGEVADPALRDELDPIVVHSGSSEHLHTYVPLTRPIDLALHARLNRALADRLGGDAKWSDESLLRLPGTLNYKVDPPAPVQVVRPSGRVWDPDELAELLDVDLTSAVPRSGPGASRKDAHTPPTIVAEPAPDPLPSRVQAALDHEDITDRSRAHHRVVGACRDAGLSAGQTLTVASSYGPSRKSTVTDSLRR